MIGDRYAIDCTVASGQPIAIRNGSITGGLLHTLPGLGWARFVYDGAIWRREDSGAVSATG